MHDLQALQQELELARTPCWLLLIHERKQQGNIREQNMSLCQSLQPLHYFMVSIDGRQVAEAEDAAEVSASN